MPLKHLEPFAAVLLLGPSRVEKAFLPDRNPSLWVQVEHPWQKPGRWEPGLASCLPWARLSSPSLCPGALTALGGNWSGLIVGPSDPWEGQSADAQRLRPSVHAPGWRQLSSALAGAGEQLVPGTGRRCHPPPWHLALAVPGTGPSINNPPLLML